MAGDKMYAGGNSILREMAKDVLREPWLVRINATVGLGLRIVKDGDRNRLFISLRRPAVEGDTVYRKFPVTDVLFPSHISMKLRWANRADTSGYTEESLVWKSISPKDSLLCVVPVALFDPEVDTLMVREIEFFYDSLALKTFFDRIELIHDYYASVLLLDSLQQFTANLTLDNSGLLPLNFLKIEELCSVIKRIDARDFPGRLLQNGFDPSGLVVKYQQMLRHSRSLVYNFMDELHKTGAIPWNSDADRLAMYFTSRVLSYVNRSNLMDQQQGRIYNDCLDHFFDVSAFPPEEATVAMILSKMFPDAGQDTIARFFSQRIYAAYRITARRLMEQNQYAEAFSMLDNGRRFISANPSMQGVSPDDLLQSEAAQGICNSYIGIASSCIRNHRYNMAETYLSKADQYAASQAKYIRSDSAYRAVFSELFFLRNAECDQALDQKKYAEALECYRQFEKAYSARDLALVSAQLNEKKSVAQAGLGNLSALLTEDALKRKDADTALFYYEKATALRKEAGFPQQSDTRLDSLAPVMARIKFEQITREGGAALEKRQYTLAVTLLKEAKSLADKYGISRGNEFDSVYRQSMKYYLIVQLTAAQKRIWANQFDSARAALLRTEAAGFDYGLLNDPDFITVMDKYKVKIREQHCRNLQDSIDLRMIIAGRGIALLNFIKAVSSLQEALDFSRSMADCGFDERPIVDTLAKYGQAAGYQKKLSDIRSLVVSGNYSEAVLQLNDSQQNFSAFNLGRFGLHMVAFDDYLVERENPYFTEKAVSLRFEQKNYKEALRFLKLAHDQGLSATSCVSMQEQLAVRFAQEDFRANPKDEAGRHITDHIPPDKWFDAFRKAYISEWNQLGKSLPE
jgi:tetratricopeptide (TPR) repeat protein